MDTASEFAIEIVMSWKGTVLETDLVSTERPRSVFIGNEGAVRFLLPTEVLSGRHALVTCTGEPGSIRYSVCAPEGAELIASRNGEACESGSQIGIEPGVIAEVRAGDFVFFVQPTAQPERAPAGPLFEGGASRYIAGVLAAHAVMLAAFFFLPPSANALNLDLLNRDERYISAHLTPPQSIDELLEHEAGGESQGESPNDAPAEASDAGGEDPTPRVAGGRGRPDASTVRSDTPITATTVSSLGTFSAIANAFDHAGVAPGTWGSEHLMDGPGGPGLVAALAGGIGDGFGGLDMNGIGIGTCRPGEVCGRGTIGVGHLATRGGTGPGVGPGTGGGLHRDRVGPPRTPEGEVHTTGGLSREIIRRTIRRHMNEVRYCYERELTSNPSLEGRVSVTFVIAPGGSVTNASGTSDAMSSVSTCVAGAVRRWTFPESEGPTGVTYPFVFQSRE